MELCGGLRLICLTKISTLCGAREIVIAICIKLRGQYNAENVAYFKIWHKLNPKHMRTVIGEGLRKVRVLTHFQCASD